MSAIAVAIRIVADRVGGRTAVWPGVPPRRQLCLTV